MNIQEKIEQVRGKIGVASSVIKETPGTDEFALVFKTIISSFVQTAECNIFILEEIQKTQQVKPCKWREVSDCVYKTDCGMTFTTLSTEIGKTINYCENCGGKIEIDRGTK